MDVFITLLSLGVNGYKNLITQRKEMYTYLKEELTKVALKHGERLLETKNNPISLGIRCFNNNYNSYDPLLIFKICFPFSGRCLNHLKQTDLRCCVVSLLQILTFLKITYCKQPFAPITANFLFQSTFILFFHFLTPPWSFLCKLNTFCKNIV